MVDVEAAGPIYMQPSESARPTHRAARGRSRDLPSRKNIFCIAAPLDRQQYVVAVTAFIILRPDLQQRSTLSTSINHQEVLRHTGAVDCCVPAVIARLLVIIGLGNRDNHVRNDRIRYCSSFPRQLSRWQCYHTQRMSAVKSVRDRGALMSAGKIHILKPLKWRTNLMTQQWHGGGREVQQHNPT